MNANGLLLFVKIVIFVVNSPALVAQLKMVVNSRLKLASIHQKQKIAKILLIRLHVDKLIAFMMTKQMYALVLPALFLITVQMHYA